MNHLDPHSDDPREQMQQIFDDIGALARFLVHLDYPEDEIKTVLRRDFPGQDADAAYAAAVEHKRKCDSELQSQLDAEARAAREAELDLDKTMHIDHPRFP